MVFELCLREKQTNKQTIKAFPRLAKSSFKTQLKNTSYLIKLKLSEAFEGKQSFKLRYYVKITTKISVTGRISP